MRTECECHIAPAGDGGLRAATILHTSEQSFPVCLLCAPDARLDCITFEWMMKQANAPFDPDDMGDQRRIDEAGRYKL